MKKLRLRTRILLFVLLAIFLMLITFATIALIGSRAIFGEIEKIEAVSKSRALDFQKADGINNAFIKNDASGNDFKILHISDIHFVCSIFSFNDDLRALNAVVDLVNATKPDLIVATGDLLYSVFYNGSINNGIGAEAIGKMFEAFEIPWAVTFGNHDAEFFNLMNLAKQAEYYESLEFSLFSRGPSDIEGEGNYIVELLNSDGTLNTALFMLDCNGYDGMLGVYNYIRDGQVDWYKAQVDALNAREGKTVSSLMFVHIPLYEYRLAEEALNDGSPDAILLRGQNHESISSTAKPDGKMFDALLKKGSTKGVFCGHDHVNHTAIKYKGITLAYGMSIEYSAYAGGGTVQRGGQLIAVDSAGDVKIALVPQSDNYSPTEFVEI